MSCLFDEEQSKTKLVKDFWLNWWGDDRDTHLLRSDDGRGGAVIIPETIFAIGYNKDFIIAKQHPNKEDEVSERLFGKFDNETGDFELVNPDDRVYLDRDDSIYKKNGKWYHISNGWNPPDSLKPYRKITYYHIIDLRKYDLPNGLYKSYISNDSAAFQKTRDSLGVPKQLNFTIVKKHLE